MRWLWWRANGEAKRERAAAEAKLRAVKRQTPTYERLADSIADLPADELADRLRRALMVRRV